MTHTAFLKSSDLAAIQFLTSGQRNIDTLKVGRILKNRGKKTPPKQPRKLLLKTKPQQDQAVESLPIHTSSSALGMKGRGRSLN